MKKILTIIGARPQIIKAAALSRAIRNNFSQELQEIIVHTGQHYDENMSQVFFDELDIPRPAYNLNVGSGSHGLQTAGMIEGIEKILLEEKPSALILYGDTNSTLAGAVAASKLHVPVVHIEAGLRSFNKSMPEEINRILCDHISTLLFSPTKAGVNNLIREGFKEDTQPPFSSDRPRIYHCGDVMYDNSMHFSSEAENKTSILKEQQLQKENFILATIHRNNNTDVPLRLQALFLALDKIAEKEKTDVVIPLHPRTKKLLEENLGTELFIKIQKNSRIKIIPPVSFLEMIALEKNARLIMTDSGGVQKEAFFFNRPCIIFRPETEWVELVECGAAILVDADEHRIIEAFEHFRKLKNFPTSGFFGDGKAAQFICSEIIKHL